MKSIMDKYIKDYIKKEFLLENNTVNFLLFVTKYSIYHDLKLKDLTEYLNKSYIKENKRRRYPLDVFIFLYKNNILAWQDLESKIDKSADNNLSVDVDNSRLVLNTNKNSKIYFLDQNDTELIWELLGQEVVNLYDQLFTARMKGKFSYLEDIINVPNIEEYKKRTFIKYYERVRKLNNIKPKSESLNLVSTSKYKYIPSKKNSISPNLRLKNTNPKLSISKLNSLGVKKNHKNHKPGANIFHVSENKFLIKTIESYIDKYYKGIEIFGNTTSIIDYIKHFETVKSLHKNKKEPYSDENRKYLGFLFKDYNNTDKENTINNIINAVDNHILRYKMDLDLYRIVCKYIEKNYSWCYSVMDIKIKCVFQVLTHYGKYSDYFIKANEKNIKTLEDLIKTECCQLETFTKYDIIYAVKKVFNNLTFMDEYTLRDIINEYISNFYSGDKILDDNYEELYIYIRDLLSEDFKYMQSAYDNDLKFKKFLSEDKNNVLKHVRYLKPKYDFSTSAQEKSDSLKTWNNIDDKVSFMEYSFKEHLGEQFYLPKGFVIMFDNIVLKYLVK